MAVMVMVDQRYCQREKKEKIKDMLVQYKSKVALHGADIVVRYVSYVPSTRLDSEIG